jgi:hypothetical protein
MAVVLPIFGFALAAFCVWLTVRIVNRRERWAKWTAVGLAVVLLYPLSIGPACWISSRTNTGAAGVSVVYRPLTWCMSHSEQIAHSIHWYSKVGSANGWFWGSSVNRDNTWAWRSKTWDWQPPGMGMM